MVSLGMYPILNTRLAEVQSAPVAEWSIVEISGAEILHHGIGSRLMDGAAWWSGLDHAQPVHAGDLQHGASQWAGMSQHHLETLG
jgi:hypothetical protein